ncbi:MAG: hypothetical protein ACTHPD_16265 [Rhizomicrobium sp.]
MHAFVTIAAMTAIFAAHVVMMVELRPRDRETAKDKDAETLGENL